MAIISPEPSIPLPEDIVRATENARNNLTLLEAEIFRLTKLKKQINAEIINMEGAKNEIENELPILQKRKGEI